MLVVVVFAAVFAVLVVGAVVLAKAGVGPWRFGSADRAAIGRAVAADIAAVRESDRYFRADGPGRDPDDL